MRPIHSLKLLCCAGALLCGCAATLETEPAYVEVDYVPAQIETYPYVVYEGHPVYYVNDRWYFRHRSGWVYYRDEPEVLHRQRPYVRQAPPAYREYRRPYYSAPPPAREAPPAHEVR